jgi:putative component of membrane protein insertase Oxa1/YidC/SpoIIIJ protein YidD
MSVASLVIQLIRRYQQQGGSRAYFGIECNFEPTCSEFTCQALDRYGLWRGLRISIARIRRCSDRDSLCKHHDPVPELSCR